MVQPQLAHRPPSRPVLESYVHITGATYTAKAGDRFIGVNRAGAVTVTLPTAEVRKGRVYTIKDESGAAASNNITIDTEGSETIDGSATDTIASNYEVRTYYSDGTNWFIIPVIAFDATSPSTQAHGDAAAVGTAAVAARRDHKHAMPTGLANVLEDTTPQLGGDLDANGKDITGIGHVGFLATQDASAGANDLDDYEEGTFTPTIQDDSLSNGESQTYTTQVGRYTKIGNTVFFQLRLVVSSIGTLTTGQGARVAGLPFTSNTTANNRVAVHVAEAGGLSITASENVTGIIVENTTYIYLTLYDGTAGTSALLLSEFTADGAVTVAGHYEV